MRILGLLNSNVNGGDAKMAAEALFPARMRDPLAKRLGEEVEIDARAVWPTPALPAAVERWLMTFQPELVVFPIGAFWFQYESLPVRMDKQFGPVGRMICAVSLKAAATPWLAHNPAFQSLRRTVQKRVHGRAHFQPGEVIDVASKVIRTVLSHEGPYLVVMAPAGGDSWATDDAARKRVIHRRAMVDGALRQLCDSLHVEYWTLNQIAAAADPRRGSLQGDRLHLDEEGHRRHAEAYLELTAGMALRAREHVDGLAAGAAIAAN